MNYVKFNLTNKYASIVEDGALSYIPYMLKGASKLLIVADENVYSLYKAKLVKELEKVTKVIFAYTFPKGETSKSKNNLDKLLLYMSEINMLKTDCVVSFGGGTVSDLAGFCAGIFKRGIPYINIPTTLLSMADASVGGKTAVDFMGRKNMLGVIYQPKAVFCDTEFLTTLPQKEISSGYAEIIKCAIIGDEKTFCLLEQNALNNGEAIISALNVKAKIVKKDEYDKNVRQLLNFGHTFGHAIESLSDFSITHGEAVAYGMITACEIAEKLNFSSGILSRLKKVLQTYKIKYDYKIDKARTWEFVLSDKKREGDKIAMILPKKIGKCVIKKIPVNKIREAYLGF